MASGASGVTGIARKTRSIETGAQPVMVFEYIIWYSPRRRASPCLAEGFSPTARGAYRIYFSISRMPALPGAHSHPGRMPALPGAHSHPGRMPALPGAHSHPGRMPALPGAHSHPGRMPALPGAHSHPGRMVFEELFRHSPRRRASPCLAEGFSPTARGAYRIYFSISMMPALPGAHSHVHHPSAYSAPPRASNRLTRRREGAERAQYS